MVDNRSNNAAKIPCKMKQINSHKPIYWKSEGRNEETGFNSNANNGIESV
ncbi:hypothetical protein THII_2739 [Thioploca ingrica]|uniref:Uncharacterized protein n=1 Tax=Thioploca ingrica TaxID=40754 RepID=A0A090BVK9_9GAMM|nr:hypothetical protein THII_2739 [Thioploca ingrica]